MIYSRGNEEAEVTMRIEKGENMENELDGKGFHHRTNHGIIT